MPKKDVEPPHANTLDELLSIGQIRAAGTDKSPLQALVGAQLTMSVQIPKGDKRER